MSRDEYTLEELRDRIAECERLMDAEKTTGSERRTLKWELTHLKSQIAERGDK